MDGLDELWRRRIIREVGGESYDFSHDRIRDVAYATISQARRRLLHRRAGEALLRVHGREAGAVQGQLGYHFASAGDNPAAIGHFRQAAAVALERYAHTDAASYLTAAITLAASAGDAALYPLLAERERVNRAARRMDEWVADLALLTPLVERMHDGSPQAIRRAAVLTLSRHYRASWAGDSSLALCLAQEAAELAQSCGDQAIEAEALLRCGQELWAQGSLDAAQPILIEGYAKAMAAGLPALAGISLERQAQIQMFAGGSAARIGELLRESLRLYEDAGSETGVSEILNKLGYLPLAQGYGDYAEVLAHFARGMEIAQRIGHRAVEVNLLRNLALLHTCQGEYRRAQERWGQAQDVIDRAQDEPNRGVIENYRGFGLLQQGRLAAAKATQEKALALLRSHRRHLWTVRAITALGWIAFYEGDWVEAEARATEAIAESEAFNEERQIAHSCTLRGWARLRLGRVDEAIPDFQRSAEILLRLEMENRAQEPLAGLAQAALQKGDLPAASAQAIPIAQHLLAHPLDRTADTFLAIQTCHAILRGAGDPLAAAVQELALSHLRQRAGQIDPAHLDGFWAMPGHRELAYTDIAE